jgi:hypothetical protein
MRTYKVPDWTYATRALKIAGALITAAIALWAGGVWLLAGLVVFQVVIFIGCYFFETFAQACRRARRIFRGGDGTPSLRDGA